MKSPPLSDDPYKTELFPEPPSSRREKREVNSEKVATLSKLEKPSAAKKDTTVLKKSLNKSVGRPATRSNPIVQSGIAKKTAIRGLIQKKKLKSLRTLNDSQFKKRSTISRLVKVETKTKLKTETSIEELNSTYKTQEDSSTVRRLRTKPSSTPEPTQEKSKKPIVKKIKHHPKPDEVDKKSDAGTRRPVRKCSTVDKMWIDVDGFTSDEDDFIDVGSLTAGKEAPKGKPDDSTVEKAPNPLSKNEGNAALQSNEKKDNITKSVESKEKEASKIEKNEDGAKCAKSKNAEDTTKIEVDRKVQKPVEVKPTEKSQKKVVDLPKETKIEKPTTKSSENVAVKDTADLSLSMKDTEKADADREMEKNKGKSKEVEKASKVKDSKKPAVLVAEKNNSEPNNENSGKVKNLVKSGTNKSMEKSKKSAAMDIEENKSEPHNENSKNSVKSATRKSMEKSKKSAVIDMGENKSVPPNENSGNLTKNSVKSVKNFDKNKEVDKSVKKKTKDVGIDSKGKGVEKSSKDTSKVPKIKNSEKTAKEKSPEKDSDEKNIKKTKGSATTANKDVSLQDSIDDRSKHSSVDPIVSPDPPVENPKQPKNSQSKDSTSGTNVKTPIPIDIPKITPISPNVPTNSNNFSSPPSCAIVNTHALIARLANNVSMTSKPSYLKTDFPNDLKLALNSPPDPLLKIEVKSEDDKPLLAIKSDKKPCYVKTKAESPVSKNFLTEFKPIVKAESLSSKSNSLESIFKAGGTIRKPLSLESKNNKSASTHKNSQTHIPFPLKRKDDFKNKSETQDPIIGHNTNKEAKPQKVRCGRPKKIKIGEKMSEKGSDDKSSSEDSEDNIFRSARKRGRRPSPRAEVVARRERPKRQCSASGPSWIDRDSDDDTFYEDNDQDLLELIKRSELEYKAKLARSNKRPSNPKRDSDTFSESDEEPLMKKTVSAASPMSFLTTETSEGPFAKESSLERRPRVLDDIPPPAVTFITPPRREPINTHGLDLLSEAVVAADKSSARIEQWLRESQRPEPGKSFAGFGENEPLKSPTPLQPPIPNPIVQFVRPSSDLMRPPAPEPKKFTSKPTGEVLKRPPVSSVHDLIKLQKERREAPKPETPDQHSKNCKCNSCVVKKGWFKNKPMPEEAKSVSKEVSPSKPFQAVSQAFGEVVTSKASVTVTPMIQSRESSGGDTKPVRKMSFLERMRERERKEAMVKPISKPFSPSNESSVYAFEVDSEKPNDDARSSASTTSPSTSMCTTATTTTPVKPKEPPKIRHQGTSIAVQVILFLSHIAIKVLSSAIDAIQKPAAKTESSRSRTLKCFMNIIRFEVLPIFIVPR